MPPHFVAFHDLLLVETVRAVEADTPLEDTVALRAAVEAATRREDRLVERARVLARSLRLEADIEGVRRAANWLALLLLAAGAVLASSIVAAVLGGDRTLNAAAALGLALVPNLVGLPIWIVAVALARGGEGVLGRALRQAARLGWLSNHAPQVLAAAARLLDRHRLTAWVWGGVNHALWALAYLIALAAMAFAFGVRSYRLGWETTILPPGFFDGLYRLVAWGPVPGAGTLAAGGEAASAALAWWLLGGVAAYGLGLRVFALAVCWGRWRYGRRRLAIDLSDPYFRRLLNRFDALAPTRIVDVERHGPGGHGGRDRAGSEPSANPVVLAFELPPEAGVPPAVGAAAAWSERIDGTRDERDAVLRRLAERRPGRLLLVCHAGSTPDRGTRRFLAEARAPSTAVLLVPTTGRPATAAARWRAWLDDSGMADVPALADEPAALAWLEHGDG
jgi:hypothetical protein